MTSPWLAHPPDCMREPGRPPSRPLHLATSRSPLAATAATVRGGAPTRPNPTCPPAVSVGCDLSALHLVRQPFALHAPCDLLRVHLRRRRPFLLGDRRQARGLLQLVERPVRLANG